VRVWALSAALVAVAAVLYFGYVIRLPAPGLQVQVPWWALAGLFIVSEIAVVHIQFRRDSTSFSLNELPLVAGLYFTNPAGMVAAQAVGAAIALALHRRQPPLKLVFNVAKLSLEAAVAQLVFHAVVGNHPLLGVYGWLGALIAIAVVDTLGALIVQTVIALSEGRPGTSELLRAVALAVAGGFTSGSIALLGVTVIGAEPAGVLLLVIPAVMLYVAYRAYVAEQARQESIGLLYEANHILQRAGSLETAVMDLLEHLRSMFRAEVAEITLLPSGRDGAEVAVRSRLGPDDATETLVEVEIEPMHLALARLPSEARGTMIFTRHSDRPLPDRLRSLGVRDAMVTQLEGEHRLIGTVMVANRVGDRFSFDDKDRRLFETLASQASFSLENGRLEQTLAGMRREHAELEHKALHDSLTKLANRVLYIDRVRHALSKRDEPGKDVAVMYVDLDDFKTVNDSLGHAAGDALLVQVADRMTVSVRPDDTVARLGGDEFAVLMTDVANEAEATNVAKRILDSLNTPFELQGREVWAHATIGIALAAPGELEVADLLRRADQAMYTAKGEGKGRYAVFGDRMRVGFLEPRSKRRA
jgi:diguanylate cyclase (GGDEF)-like protein